MKEIICEREDEKNEIKCTSTYGIESRYCVRWNNIFKPIS